MLTSQCGHGEALCGEAKLQPGGCACVTAQSLTSWNSGGVEAAGPSPGKCEQPPHNNLLVLVLLLWQRTPPRCPPASRPVCQLRLAGASGWRGPHTAQQQGPEETGRPSWLLWHLQSPSTWWWGV